MVIKVYNMKGTVAAASTNVTIDKLSTPSGVERTLQEIRYYCSLPADVEVMLYLGTEAIYDFEAQVNDYIKLPYPANLKMKAGDELRLVCTNRNTTTAATVKVEIVCEETVTK
jgi:hypothetical protein